jgi:hypothetical protein
MNGVSLAICYAQAMQVTVEIPDQFVRYLVPAGRDAGRSLLEESVAGAYRDGRLTMEQVRELLSFGTRMQVDAFLPQHDIYEYTVEDLDKDMAKLDRCLQRTAGSLRDDCCSRYQPAQFPHQSRPSGCSSENLWPCSLC